MTERIKSIKNTVSNGHSGWYSRGDIMFLISAIESQETEIATLKNRNADLKSQLLKSAKVMSETSDVILSGK